MVKELERSLKNVYTEAHEPELRREKKRTLLVEP